MDARLTKALHLAEIIEEIAHVALLCDARTAARGPPGADLPRFDTAFGVSAAR